MKLPGVGPRGAPLHGVGVRRAPPGRQLAAGAAALALLAACPAPRTAVRPSPSELPVEVRGGEKVFVIGEIVKGKGVVRYKA